MSIIIFNGLPGSGKTTLLASKAREIAIRNRKFYIKQEKLGNNPTKRKIVLNIKLSSDFKAEFDGFYDYWSDMEQLVKLRDCDIFIDEVATYLDSTQWANVPLPVKRFLQLHRHYGIDIFGTTQDFPMVDISMRRLVESAYMTFKLLGTQSPSPTKKTAKHPWILCVVREIQRASFNLPKEEYKYSGFNLRYFDEKDFSIFDTTQELEVGEYPPLKHIARKCGDENCSFHKVTHV